MASDVTCEVLREVGAEMALGVLPGRERAVAVAHLDRCAACREYIEHMTLVGDGLIGLVPGSEPPLGFETRVARRLPQDVAAHEGDPRARASDLAHKAVRSRARRVRLRVASAAAAFALAFGFTGWAVGTAIESVTASSSPAVKTQTPLMEGQLTSGLGQSVGDVYAHPGDPGKPGWIYMTVDLAAVGTPYSGKVVCLLERTDGTTIRVGTFTLSNGRGDWGAAAPVDPAALSGARLTTSDGTVLATGHFETGRST
ncbi:zf-HC2 domain-containing protein [Streptomyces avermitilis]|uniref:zf-HC2 domain-containing protein n=1 Tax=Streptomyces avermitilis TaxID=33903 RepID=UPI00339F4F98